MKTPPNQPPPDAASANAQSAETAKRWRGLGCSMALIGLLIDQAHKLYMLRVVDIARVQPIELTPYFDLIMVWNYGVSYGLFQQYSDVGRFALVGISIIAAAALLIWIWRTSSWLVAISAGLICGGAIGNAIDRIAYGAVADFFHLHIGDFSWYVFNFADAFIVAGVIGLIIEPSFQPKTASPQK